MDKDLEKLKNLFGEYDRVVKEYNELEDEKREKEELLSEMSGDYILFLHGEDPTILQPVLEWKIRKKFQDELKAVWDYDKILRPMERRLRSIHDQIVLQEKIVNRNNLIMEKDNALLKINGKEGE
jgi:hypothetical protein